MTIGSRSLLVLVVFVAVVLWLSFWPVRWWLAAGVVLASLALGVQASLTQRRLERRWMGARWTRGANTVSVMFLGVIALIVLWSALR
jgi:hypothetical protein